MVLSQKSIDALNSFGQLLLDKDIAMTIILSIFTKQMKGIMYVTIDSRNSRWMNMKATNSMYRVRGNVIDEKLCIDVRLLYILHIIRLLVGSVIFTENLREICTLLEKLQEFICWKSAIAVNWGGKKLPPYKWKGDESRLISCFNHE